jgi:hypothetical protein
MVLYHSFLFPPVALQVCAVGELVHLKLIMLAIHQDRVEDAVAQVGAEGERENEEDKDIGETTILNEK